MGDAVQESCEDKGGKISAEVEAITKSVSISIETERLETKIISAEEEAGEELLKNNDTEELKTVAEDDAKSIDVDRIAAEEEIAKNAAEEMKINAEIEAERPAVKEKTSKKAAKVEADRIINEEAINK